MKLFTGFLILGCGLTTLSKTANGQESQYTFDSDLDSLVSTNGIWQWSNREGFPWVLPDGPDGFAVQYMPGDGDTLYESEVDIQYGFDIEITYFISSEEAGTTVLKIQQLDINGNVLQDIEEYQSDPMSSQWVTNMISGTSAGDGVPSRFGVFCQTSSINFVDSIFYGCAIDSITVNAYPAPTTTVEQTENTEELTTTAASTEDNILDFNFLNDTQGWLLGSSNGVSWRRVPGFFIDPSVPTMGGYLLQIFSTDVYAGTALATSPRLRIGSSGRVTIIVEFYLRGTPDYPVYLKLRRRLSYTEYDEDVVLNMDPFGDQVNEQWQTVRQAIVGLTPGDEFNLVLEGNPGIDNQFFSQIMVSRVYLEGVSIVEYDETEIFDFSDGLVGWQAGSMDGGKWRVVNYANIDPALNVPPPSSPYLLMVDRYDIHSGVITIESPPIPTIPCSTKELLMRLWVRGSQVYPVTFRLNLKSLGGVYDPLPFVDLTPQGDSNSQVYVTLTDSTIIPVDPRATEFQLVFEVDLGGDINNLIAIDAFRVRTGGNISGIC